MPVPAADIASRDFRAPDLVGVRRVAGRLRPGFGDEGRGEGGGEDEQRGNGEARGVAKV